MPFDQGLSRLTRDECLQLLATATFGRVGVSVDALPAIVPVTIALMDDAVVFRTVPGTKLAAATDRSVLAVEVDEYDPGAGDGWSVLVRGIASELASSDAVDRARRLLRDSWLELETSEHYVQVACDLVTGRRLRHPVPNGKERS